MEFSVLIKELSTNRTVRVEFPTSMEEVASKLGLPEDEPFEYVIVDASTTMIKEYDSIEILNKFYEMVEAQDEDLIEGVHEVTGYTAKDFVQYEYDFDGCYLLYDVNTPRELSEYWFEQLGADGIGKEAMERYFDHEAFGRDIDLENQGGFSSKGYVDIR